MLDNMMRRGAEFVAGTLHRVGAVVVRIERDGETLLETSGILSQPTAEDFGVAERRAERRLVDVLLRGDCGYVPKADDKFWISTGPFSNVREPYRVAPLGDEVFRFDDPYEISMRVHAQKEPR